MRREGKESCCPRLLNNIFKTFTQRYKIVTSLLSDCGYNTTWIMLRSNAEKDHIDGELETDLQPCLVTEKGERNGEWRRDFDLILNFWEWGENKGGKRGVESYLGGLFIYFFSLLQGALALFLSWKILFFTLYFTFCKLLEKLWVLRQCLLSHMSGGTSFSERPRN